MLPVNKQTNKEQQQNTFAMSELLLNYERDNLLAVVAESCGTTHSRIPCYLEI